MPAEGFEFDVFISYSHQDRPWVDANLIPRLVAFNLSYAIDYKDFVAGRSNNAEMLRLISVSRHTVAVVSHNWTKSSFTDFESQLSRLMDPKAQAMRLVPFLIESVELPPRLATLAPIYWTKEGENSAWRKLHEVLVEMGTASPRSHQLDAKMELWKRFESHGGYGYEGSVAVYNPIPVGPDVLFDSVVIECADLKTKLPHFADAIRFWISEKGSLITEYAYEGPQSFGHFKMQDQGDHPKTVSLKANLGMQIPRVGFGTLRPSVAGKEVSLISVSLYLGRTPVTAPCWGVLPPVVRLTMDLTREPKNGYNVWFMKDDCASPPSGIMDEDILNQIFQTAAEYSDDSLLTTVAPQFVTVIHFSGGEHLHRATNWQYNFFSEKQHMAFSISTMDPTWVEQGDPTEVHPKLWLHESLIRSCKVDATAAYLISLSTGSQAFEEGRGSFALRPAVLDDTWRAVWHTPRHIDGFEACVLADTGELIIKKTETFTKPRNIIWNA